MIGRVRRFVFGGRSIAAPTVTSTCAASAGSAGGGTRAAAGSSLASMTAILLSFPQVYPPKLQRRWVALRTKSLCPLRHFGLSPPNLDSNSLSHNAVVKESRGSLFCESQRRSNLAFRIDRLDCFTKVGSQKEKF